MMIHRNIKAREEAAKAVSSKPKKEPEKEVSTPEATSEEKVFSYTKSEISGMKTGELQELGAKLGIENANTKTGGALKKEIIEFLKL